jgi:16S rRNA G966 N2-methylase RsmD
MYTNCISDIDKKTISRQIKKINLELVDKEMSLLMKYRENHCNKINISSRCRTGNNIVDYFTFLQRLETRGKYNANFFDFLSNIDEFKKKKFIQTMLTYYKDVKNKKGLKNDYTVMKEVYNICISAINIMRPLNCIEIFLKYNSKKVLNFCAGWGGTTVAAAALNLESHYGIEINGDLEDPYKKMIEYLKTKSTTQFNMSFCDATTFDYSTIDYDTVFSSPPYYFIEKYANNNVYSCKNEMDEKFYIPLFRNSYFHLKTGGHFIINVSAEIYERVLKPLFGKAGELFPLKKSKRQNNYTEMVYIYKK